MSVILCMFVLILCLVKMLLNMVDSCVLLRWITWNLMARRSVDADDAHLTTSKPTLHFLLVSVKPAQLLLLGSHLCPP